MLEFLGNADVSMLIAADAILPPSWRWDDPGSDTWRGMVLWVIVEGQGSMREGGSHWPVARGDIFLMRHDRVRQGRHDPEHPLVIPWCVFDARDAEVRQQLTASPGTQRFRVPDIDFVAELLRRGIAAFQAGDPQSTLWLRTVIMELLVRGDAGPQNEGNVWADRLDRIADTMRRYPERRYRVPDLARACCCDPDHFARVFRRRFGVAPGRFAIRCRIDRARSLLQFTDQGVETIANRLGYDDPYFFSRQFKHLTGLSPSAFRDDGKG